MKDFQPQTLQVYPVQCVPEDGEISLVDLWLIFRNHSKIFVRTFLVVTLLGLLTVFFIPKKYDLKTSLEIGTSLQNDAPVPIEAPETVKAKLENSFIPLVINRLSVSDEDSGKYKVRVQIPKKSTLVVLGSTIEEGEEQRYKAFHKAIIEAIVSDHRSLIDVLKKKIETELELARIHLAEVSDPATLKALVNREKKKLEEARAQLGKLTDPVIFGTRLKEQENAIKSRENELASLKDEQKVLAAKLERITSQQELIRSEIASLQKRIDNSLALQLESVRHTENPSNAMSQLLIDSQITEDRKWLAKLKEQLHIALENERAEVEKALKDNARSQKLAQARIEQARGVLEELKSTNKLEQSKLQAQIDEIEANIQKLANNQKRLIQTQEQVVDELLAKLDNFVETRAVVEPTRSPEPTSLSRKILLLLVLFLGGVLALIAVFIEELRDRIRERESHSLPS